MSEATGNSYHTLFVIEVRGVIDAAIVADAMFKSSSVDLLRSLRVGGGRVAMWIGGELSEVNAAADAAFSALGEGREGNSCTFTMPSESIRQFIEVSINA